MSERQAVILAGGLGTRLRTVLGDTPKALAEVGGIPVLNHQIELCRRHGFDDVILLLGHAADTVVAHVGDGSRFGVTCRCYVEEKPLGTAGAVLAARDLLRDRFLVMYCDTMLDVDLDRLWTFAEARRAAVALLVHPNDHPFDSDLVVTDSEDRIVGFSRWNEESGPLRNLASAALYVMEKSVLESVPAREGIFDFGRHVFPYLVEQGETLVAYRSVEYIKDLGTPERLAKVNQDFASGKVDPQRSGRLRPAVFLDRDGVINIERGGVLSPSEMELMPGAAAGIQRLNTAGLATIVVTNQPYVSHGKLDEATLDTIHAAMERDLALCHAFVDAVYYCPHHPHRGYEGERPELKIDCDCRKPKPGMLLRAAEDLHLDLASSWMIGDRTGDIEAARRAGVRPVLVHSGHGGHDGVYTTPPDFTFADLDEASTFITRIYPQMRAWCDQFVAEQIAPNSVILVGGLARAGKSTFTQVLTDSIASVNLDPVVLHLDNWLKDSDARSDGVLGRYDLAAVDEILACLKNASAPQEIAIPVYDRGKRQKVGSELRTVAPGAVVLCEGGPALALAHANAKRLFVRIDEEERRTRFGQFYTWRGEADQIESYWTQRQSDEAPVISASCDGAVEIPNFNKDPS